MSVKCVSFVRTFYAQCPTDRHRCVGAEVSWCRSVLRPTLTLNIYFQLKFF